MSEETWYFDPELRRTVERLLLPDVQAPGQYIGGELGSVVKRPETVKGRMVFAFPDTYSIGMSNNTLLLLYTIMNRRSDWACERVFCPLPDMEKVLREHDLPLYSLESFTPLSNFDVLGFTLQYEMCYTNVLTMIDLGQIPLHRQNRLADDPLVIAGGPCVSNPEPMSPFIDVFSIGDGEEALQDICSAWLELKQSENLLKNQSEKQPGNQLDCSKVLSKEESRRIRRERLLKLAQKFDFIYVPEFYSVSKCSTGRSGRPRPTESGVPEHIRPAVIKHLDDYPPPDRPIVPTIESVQDRISIEIMRGCPRKCRFCQSSPTKRPLRFRSMDAISKACQNSVKNSGVTEITLLSLSSSDYPHFEELLEKLRKEVASSGVSFAVPSLRVNHVLSEVMKTLSTEKTSSVTMAPEAALNDMRRRMDKRVTDEDLQNGCRSAFENGFSRVKFYFMCGLPGETEADIEGILKLCDDISWLGKQVSGKYPTVVANVSNFVPKPQTPLQWVGMQTRDYFYDVHQKLRRTKRRKSVDLKYHDLKVSLLEGLLARGDRSVGELIETVWKMGARLDAWGDHFQYDLWVKAIEEVQPDIENLVHRSYSLDEELPWEHIETLAGRDWLIKEYEASLEPASSSESSDIES